MTQIFHLNQQKMALPKKDSSFEWPTWIWRGLCSGDAWLIWRACEKMRWPMMCHELKGCAPPPTPLVFSSGVQVIGKSEIIYLGLIYHKNPGTFYDAKHQIRRLADTTRSIIYESGCLFQGKLLCVPLLTFHSALSSRDNLYIPNTLTYINVVIVSMLAWWPCYPDMAASLATAT